MPNFKGVITETAELVVDIEANSAEDAHALVKKQWDKGEIILDSSHFVDVEFQIEEQDLEPVLSARLFVDMDGTLAEFHPVDTLEALYEKGYFENLPPNQNVVHAISSLIASQLELDVHILSAYLSDSPYALEEKKAWLDKYLPELPEDRRIFVPCGQDKKAYVPGGIRPTDCLLDDYSLNLHNWEPPAMGIKLLNGINGSHGTWTKESIRYDAQPEVMAATLSRMLETRYLEITNPGALMYEEISLEQAMTFISSYAKNPKAELSTSRYLAVDNEEWIAIDNSTGDCWVESFKNRSTAISWLMGEIEMSDLTAEDFGRPGLADKVNTEEGIENMNNSEARATEKEPIEVLLIEPGKVPEPVTISGDLKSMQALVHGYIEAIYPYEDMVALVCNEEGKLDRLPLNRALRDEEGKIYDIVAGSFFICGLEENDFSSLPPELMEKYKDKFLHPEAFARVNGEIVSIKQPVEMPKNETKKALDTANEILTSYEKDPKRLAEFLAFRAKHELYQYSPRNTLLIYNQNPGAVIVNSYNSWKGQGYHVSRGQKGLKILVPAQVTLFRPHGAEKYKRLSQATPAEKKDVKSGKIKTVVKSTYVIGHVFDISQTDFPKEKYPEMVSMGVPSEKHAQAYDALKEYLQGNGVQVKETDLNSVALRGSYNSQNKTITINKLLDDTEKLSTLCHEAGHAAYNHRLTKDIPESVLECQADAYAICLESHLGIEQNDIRKSHFSDHFKACAGLENFTADSLLKNVGDKFMQEWENIEPYMAPVMNQNPEPVPDFTQTME